MKTIKAFECEHTGAIFKSDVQAARSEFKALMREASGHLPPLGSIAPKDIFEWLGNNLIGSTYPLALPALLKALAYLQEHKAVVNDLETAHISPQSPSK